MAVRVLRFYPDSSSSAGAFVAAGRSEFIRIDLLVKGVLIAPGLSCRWWKFATRELYGMKFMQSNIKLDRDLSNLQIGSVQRGWLDIAH